MASAAEQYTQELAQQFHYLATWMPGVPIEVGQIGTIEGNVFSPISTLGGIGIAVDVEKSPDAEQTLSYASEASVSYSFKAAGQLSQALPNVPQAKAGIGLTFSRENATVFVATGLTFHRIVDELALRRAVAARMQAHEWDKEWLIVTNVVGAASTTAIVSRSSGSSLEVSLGADVAGGGLELLTAEFAPSIVSSREMSLTIVGSGPMTPLFRAKRAKRKFFSGQAELRASFAADLDDLIAEEDPEDDDSIFDEISVFGQL